MLRWLSCIVGFLVFVYLQSSAVQTYWDSCRAWRDPPLWRAFCPPSTIHGNRS
jgi:hypothetical protein